MYFVDEDLDCTAAHFAVLSMFEKTVEKLKNVDLEKLRLLLPKVAGVTFKDPEPMIEGTHSVVKQIAF